MQLHRFDGVAPDHGVDTTSRPILEKITKAVEADYETKFHSMCLQQIVPYVSIMLQPMMAHVRSAS